MVKMRMEIEYERVIGPTDGIPPGPDDEHRRPEDYRDKYRRRRQVN